jgi:magnesium-dependent phosphatase 1
MDSVSILPELVVFDLDMCLWTPETYELDNIPTPTDRCLGVLGKSQQQGVIAVDCGSGQLLRLFPGSLLALQEFSTGRYPNTRFAVASSAVTPHATRIAYAALDLLEVYPGMSVRQVLSIGCDASFDGNIKIGRSPPLSANKAMTHFPLLQRDTGIAYGKMLYFDDCIWDDHCGQVEMKCPGVVTHRTPNGLQESDWQAALEKYQAVKSS